jgi:hypothetical protein
MLSGFFLVPNQKASLQQHRQWSGFWLDCNFPMKLLKIDRLRGLSVGSAITALIALCGEYKTGPKFEATFFIVTMIFLTVALEEIRTELRDLRDQVRQDKGREL